jgi:hypothetical protein
VLNFTIKRDTLILAIFDINTVITINDNTMLETINMYPNPTIDYFTISFELLKSDNIEISLINLIGIEVMQIYNGFVETGNFVKVVQTKNIARGTYFVRFKINGYIRTKRIVFN